MAYRASHLLIVAHGMMPSGQPWSCGLRTVNDGGYVWNRAKLDSIALASANAWQTMRNRNDIGWAHDVSFDGCTVRYIAGEGKTVELVERSPTVSAVANGTPMVMPSQCAVVATLLTARPGRSYKGRIYLPLIGIGISGTNPKGRIPGSTAANIALWTKNTIVNINGAVSSAANVIAPVPIIGVQSAHPGVTESEPVVAVRCGDIVDTQRRRRDEGSENYATSVL